MKKFKKILALLLAAAMIMTLDMAAFAAGTGTITITPPTGVDTDATNTYKIYKVFDADGNGTNISYKLVSGKTTAPAGFTVDKAGNVTYSGAATGSELTEADIAAIAAYVSESDLVATVTSTGTAAATASNLPNGFYYITTSTGTVVTIDSTNPDASVNDKNIIPELDKKAKQAQDPSYMELDANGKNAVAQVGKVIPFEATITVRKGAKGYIFHDVMDSGLEYQSDLKIKVDDVEIQNDTTKVSTTPAAGDTITATFVDSSLKTIENKTIVITYSAKVTSAALQKDPAKNTATLNYGENNGYTTDEEIVKVYNAKLSVNKKDGEGKPLAGAGFVIATEVTADNADSDDSSQAAVQEGEGSQEGESQESEASYKYYKLVNGAVTWVDSIDQADVHTSGTDGTVPAFTGLGPASYVLIEKVVPSGYNKAADQTFPISGADYTAANLEQTANVTNQAGSVLPSTGGIGTTIFYIVGGILVIGAGIVLITRRRMDA